MNEWRRSALQASSVLDVLPGHGRRGMAALALAGALASGAAFALQCGGPAEAMVIASGIIPTTEMTLEWLAEATETIVKQLNDDTREILAAIKVNTKQVVVSTDKLAAVTKASKQALAKTIVETDKEAARQDVMARFGASTGQGYFACKVQTDSQKLRQAYQDLPEQVWTAVRELDGTAGRFGDPVNTLRDRITRHIYAHCTEEEAKLGLCANKGPAAGADSDASLLFRPLDPDSETRKGRDLFIANVVGLPDPSPPHADGKLSPEGESYLYYKYRKDTLTSIPAYSLQAVALANTRSKALDGKSPSELLANRLGQYFGGDGAAQWTASLQQQAGRGVLIEANKLHGLEAWLRVEEYRRNERISANLAAMLALRGERLREEVLAAHAALVRSRTTAATMNSAGGGP